MESFEPHGKKIMQVALISEALSIRSRLKVIKRKYVKPQKIVLPPER